MTIELTPHETAVLHEALEVWQKQPITDGLFGALLATSLAPTPEERHRKASEFKADAEIRSRSRQSDSIKIRAKLICAQQAEQKPDAEAGKQATTPPSHPQAPPLPTCACLQTQPQ